MSWPDKLERRLGFIAVPGLLRYVAAFTALVFILYKIDPRYLSLIDLDVDAVRAPAGEEHPSRRGGDLLRADLGRNIDARVELPEGLGDDAVGRPDEPEDLLTAAARIRRVRRLGQDVDRVVPLRRQTIDRAGLVMRQQRRRRRLRGGCRI